MKKIFLFLPIILALSFLTCDDKPKPSPPKEEEPLTLDQRLVGGRWYFSSKLDEPSLDGRGFYGYYEFNDTLSQMVFFSGFTGAESVYSKDGTVYSKDTNKSLIQYEFHDTFPYHNTAETGFTSNERHYANKLAAKGDLITCTVSFAGFNLYPNNIVPFWKFLVRFKDDGTPYQNYDE